MFFETELWQHRTTGSFSETSAASDFALWFPNPHDRGQITAFEIFCFFSRVVFARWKFLWPWIFFLALDPADVFGVSSRTEPAPDPSRKQRSPSPSEELVARETGAEGSLNVCANLRSLDIEGPETSFFIYLPDSLGLYSFLHFLLCFIFFTYFYLSLSLFDSLPLLHVWVSYLFKRDRGTLPLLFCSFSFQLCQGESLSRHTIELEQQLLDALILAGTNAMICWDKWPE